MLKFKIVSSLEKAFVDETIDKFVALEKKYPFFAVRGFLSNFSTHTRMTKTNSTK